MNQTTMVSGGRPIMEWICAGPYERDVSELYWNNYTVPLEPYRPLIEEAKRQLRECRPAEGEPLELFGQSRRWAYKRTDPSETKLTWARFGVYARFLATYAYNEIAAGRSGMHRFRIWAAGGVTVLINGKEAFSQRRVGRTEGEFRFEAELREGANECLVLLYNVHLHCTNSFTLILEDEACGVGLPLLLDAVERERVEADMAKFYMGRYMLEESDSVTISLQEPLFHTEGWSFAIYASSRGEHTPSAPVWESAAGAALHGADIRLCGCGELNGPGEYAVCIDYTSGDGSRIEGVRLPFRTVKWLAVPEAAGYPERKRALTRLYADSPEAMTPANGLYNMYAALVRLKAYPEEAPDLPFIERTIDYINRRYDCADFAMHGLLRIYYRHRDSELLPESLKASMKRCILGFKYWEDEPGPSMMFTRSENHEILFHAAEYLAGLLFPGELFTNSGQNGLFHIQKGKAMAERWIKEKGAYGFMEWHSNTYFEEDLLALLNLYDFGEENGRIRLLARHLIDLICQIIASHSYKGVMGTTHGRCYEETVIHPELESMSHINWLLFGMPELLRADRLSIGAVALMDSAYVPHEAVERIARSEEEMNTLTRMGLFPHDGLGGVNCATYRTKDYMVSGLVESMMGRHGHQVQAGQVLLDGRVPIFVTCFDNKSGMTRPSYWGGQYRMPKTIAHRNVLAYIYKIDDTAGYTHCYFPMEQFDEVLEAGDWLFGRKYNAYAAVYSLKPYVKTTAGAYKNRELLCPEKRNIWLIEAGSREQFGSFSRFVAAIASAELLRQGEELLYHSPSVGRMRLSWEDVCTIDGKSVLEGDHPLIRNDYAEGDYGSGISYLQWGGQRKILNFNI